MRLLFFDCPTHVGRHKALPLPAFCENACNNSLMQAYVTNEARLPYIKNPFSASSASLRLIPAFHYYELSVVDTVNRPAANTITDQA